MAILKHIPIKNRYYSSAVEYLTNRFYSKNNEAKDVKAHHYIISFDTIDNITMEELSAPILTKEEFEQKQIEKMQEAISERAGKLWKEALDNIDNSVYLNKWDYLAYLEELRYRNTSHLTLQ